MSTIQHSALQPPEREAAMRGLCVSLLGNTLILKLESARPVPAKASNLSVRFRRDRKM